MMRKFFFFSEMGYNAYPIEALERYGYSGTIASTWIGVWSTSSSQDAARVLDTARAAGAAGLDRHR